ncbi:MAG: M24 family metallopeptidase [Chloroflexi bacterium]|nr:M24 family metallopeptidase [Chloroflexota bacterium]
MIASSTRIGRLREAMHDAGFSGLLVSQPDSRRYLSGYTAKDLPPRDSAGYLLITEDRQYVLTDPRTEPLAAAEAPDFELRLYSGDVRMPELLGALIAEAHIKTLGFEANHVPYGLWQEIAGALESRVELKPAGSLIDRLRMVKDVDELAALRASMALDVAAFAHVARGLRAGQPESELAWEVESFLRIHGAEELAFPPITVAGPSSAIPHAVPSQRPVGADEPILFDLGARVGGYCSDMTRTFCIETVPAGMRDAWNVVLEAQLAAETQVRPGMTGAEVDAIARGVIERAGYGDAFVHSLGHGIGLEVHEPPWLSPTRGTDILLPGMAFTIEPGIYLPGLGGVRIEDVVLLTEHGSEVLTRAPKRLVLAEMLADLEGSVDLDG